MPTYHPEFPRVNLTAQKTKELLIDTYRDQADIGLTASTASGNPLDCCSSRLITRLAELF